MKDFVTALVRSSYERWSLEALNTKNFSSAGLAWQDMLCHVLGWAGPIINITFEVLFSLEYPSTNVLP
jgi:hypothetical protein